MADGLLLHPKTRQRLEDIVARPLQVVLITGQAGSGKTAVARQIVAQTLEIDDARLDSHPYFIYVQKPPDKQEISIDAVRRVIKELSLKPTAEGNQPIKRAVLFEDAGKLSEEAQNALLKTIEEPDGSTIIIMTAESEGSVLQTVASRAQTLTVIPVNLEDAISYFTDLYPRTTISSMWRLSQGAAGLLNALLSDASAHSLKQAVDEAKNFLKMDKYQRVLYLDNLNPDKPRFIEFLDALSRVLASLHQSSMTSNSQNRIKRIAGARRLVDSSLKSLSNNTSGRLIALDLALNLSL